MLKQMRKTGFARFFIFASYMVPDIEGCQWHLMVLVYDQRKTVLQYVFGIGYINLRIFFVLGIGNKKKDSKKQQQVIFHS
jgi:hypothetical protein